MNTENLINNSHPLIDQTLEEQMLDALELFRYSFAFRDQLFVVALEDSKYIDKLLTDFQVIQTSQIFIVKL